ncbi:uncharacterized protein C12orf42 homolog isoform X1 [Peromyscus eremicus]|uniref:uncharacterized protein C12orf42 homolog isoform X1 n=2 Tax=Peromyscus eremicus TaxID=42410 RepID=UPI0027DC3DC2|nr:uncharacterized protein C12orf42 homolog isoform X1 [Peromyscus eremicus]
MQKSLCYLPIVSNVTLWERGASQTNSSPRGEKTPSPCSRFVTHMKNFSASHKMDRLNFLPFPGCVEGTHSPMTGKRPLYTHQNTIPKSPMSTVSLKEEIHGEACSSLSPSREMDEGDLVFTAKKGMQKPPRGPPKQAWTSPLLEKQAANKPLERPHSVNTISSEAAGRHIPCQNHPLGKPKGDSGPVLRPFTAIGLCRSTSQNSFSPQITYRTSVEPEQQNQAAASRSWTNTDSLSVRGSAIGRGLVAVTPEMTPKHPHTAKEHRSETALTFRGRAAKEPLPMLVGSSTHLFSRKLMKVCSSAAPRPPRRSLTACSQTLSRPVVNDHLH